jgi:predicted DNA-binding ArsR family transcriptional regulator
MEAIFTREEQNELRTFVRIYESHNDTISELEKKIKDLLDAQETIVKAISQTRQDEEIFFLTVCDRTKKHPTELKKLAQAFILDEKKV